MIVIPMAGLSSRFRQAGYTRPKYMLQAHGQSIFGHAVSSFSEYFGNIPFLFILRDIDNTRTFVEDECARLGIVDPKIIALEQPTAGQAETVALGLIRSGVPPNTPITIFNIDTFRPGFRFPFEFHLITSDGYLEVFKGEGTNWSYVLPAISGQNRVAKTAEKCPISDLCCTGLYHFHRAELYLDTYKTFVKIASTQMRLTELYIAPMYNLLISQGLDIRYHVIDRNDVIFCGTPDEYEAFVRESDRA